MDRINFCTLFDSNYCDRGILLYQSMKAVEQDFNLFVVAFDKKCEEHLKKISDDRLVIIPYKEFEDDTLRMAKSNRTTREYLWTCSGYSIKYVMTRFNLECCTYIDADLYFYNSPRILIDRFNKSNSDIGIISHKYSNHYENRFYEKAFGKYCVEFNTFKNTTNGMSALDWWIGECIKCCVEKYDGEHFGDQKYLDELEDNYKNVFVYDDIGAGIAPWNIDAYRRINEKEIINTETNERGELIFYHFHSLSVQNEKYSNIYVFVRPGRHDKEFVYSLYVPYIKELLKVREKLKGNDLSKSNENIYKNSKNTKFIDFITCEPNLLFLIRKIWRYVLHRKADIISIQ